MRTLLLLTTLTLGCGLETSQASPPPLYQPDESPPSSECPEDTDLASYAFFCDTEGGISGCMVGVEPSMCDQATSTRHNCDCDSLTTCQAYRDTAGNAVIGCLK